MRTPQSTFSFVALFFIITLHRPVSGAFRLCVQWHLVAREVIRSHGPHAAAGGPVPAPLTQTLVPPAVATRRPHRKRRRPSKKESPSPGRHSLRSLRNGGKPTGCPAGVGVKRHPPAFSRFGASGSRRHGDRLAGGPLRCLLTATADELIGRSMAASPGDRRFASTPETERHSTGPAPALRGRAAQRGRDRFVTPDRQQGSQVQPGQGAGRWRHGRAGRSRVEPC